MPYDASRYLKLARRFIEKSTYDETARRIRSLVKENENYRCLECINLNAAESALSPAAKSVLNSDLERRAFLGEIGFRYHKGARYLDQIDALAVELAKKLFRVEYVEYRPTSASTAECIALRCLTEVNDTIMCLEEPRGHPSWRPQGYPGYRGLRVIDIPFDYTDYNIDINRLAQVADKTRPKVMIVGTSLFLFPHPLKEIREIADDIGAKVWYDGAHVLGLMAGERFQDPLREGAHLVTGSTQKTLSGPVGGLILHNEEEFAKKIDSVFYNHLSTIGHNRTAALAITFAEMLEFGKAFAEQMILNAKALADALERNGFDVIMKHRGYTESHALALDVADLGGGTRVAEKLEKANILCSSFKLWRPDEDYQGIRLGTTEMTRYGMKQPEMRKISEFMRRVLIDMENPPKIAGEVSEFRKRFTRVQYCYNSAD
jgi:glycine hydroxymethyltransferase